MQFLLERIAYATDPQTLSANASEACEQYAARNKAAVLAQLQRIVACSRQLAASADTEFASPHLLNCGLPSTVDIAQNSQSQLERYALRLTRLITHYEPRLLEPQVIVDAARGVLTPYRLIVTGRIAHELDVQRFHFDLPISY